MMVCSCSAGWMQAKYSARLWHIPREKGLWYLPLCICIFNQSVFVRSVLCIYLWRSSGSCNVYSSPSRLKSGSWPRTEASWEKGTSHPRHIYEINQIKKKHKLKNPAYGRHRISRPMRIEAQILFFRWRRQRGS